MNVWGYSLASVVVVSLISLVGVVTMYLSVDKLKSLLLPLVSFAVGALFGDAFIHLLPEAFEKISSRALVSLLVLGGIIIFFMLEKFIHWRHCHIPTSEEHPHPVVFMNLIGDSAHNLIDGMLIAASYIVSVPIGVATTIAVILHEIPQEIGDFGILVHGGLGREKALFFNFLSASLAILGSVVTLLIGPRLQNFSLYMLPVTAGGFIYMAGSDLMPELHKELKAWKSLVQLVLMIVGILLMLVLTFLE